jgi:hydrogenase nickel incorporation protein HypA/HybF
MHEMGIAMDILRIVQESIPAEMTGAKVQRVNLKVGQFSAIVAESLRFCFNVAAADTAAAGAELAVEEVPVVARCGDCGHAWTIEEAVFICPQCRGPKIEMLSGRELEIVSIELAEEEGKHADPQ